MQKPDKIIRNISRLYTVDSNQGEGDIGLIREGAIAFKGEKIIWTGKDYDYKRDLDFDDAEIIDAKGMIAAPGFIDCHTHLVFSGTREDEFVKRIQGKPYMDIAKEGGGIMSSVRMNRKASFDELYDNSVRRLDRMIAYGITTCEAKSGYGLETEAELKTLKVIKKLNENHSVDLVPTFLGAHEIPSEYKTKREKYIDILKNEMIPEVAGQKLAEFCDIFCEKGVYTVEESRDILSVAREYGFKIKLHADEFVDTGGAALAAELSAVSADHLMAANEEGLKRMAKAGTVAVLLPGTSFFLGSTKFAPARKMINLGLKVAIATDFNPGSSMSEFLPIMCTMACTYMRMTPEEVLKAITINAAHAVSRQKETGSLTEGKSADMVLMDIPSINYLPYHYGINHIKEVYKSGKMVISKNK